MLSKRINILFLQTLFFMLVAIGVYLFSGVRTVTFYVCTDWFTCGDQLFPSLSDQYMILEWLHHWAIIVMVASLPIVLVLAIVVFRSQDDMVMAGIRTAALLFLIQGVASVVTSITSVLWQGPALHFMAGSLLLIFTIGTVAWALFSPNQDYSPPIMRSALVVISIIPVVPYLSRFVT
jgi:hypothetical protein